MENKKLDAYFNVAIASSLVLFGFDGIHLKILLKDNTEEPFKGALILPSTYVKPQESTEKNAVRLLEEEINIQRSDTYIEQLKAFDQVFRNPLGRVVNISYYALVKLDAKKYQDIPYQWVMYDNIPDLAFDHNVIIDYAKERLKRRVKRRPVGFNLLPKEFTIQQLQTLYEKALNREMDKRNFRKKLFKSNLIIETGNISAHSDQRKAAKLYTFDADAYDKLSLKGYDFLF